MGDYGKKNQKETTLVNTQKETIKIATEIAKNKNLN